MKALPILLFALSALAGAAHADMTPAEAFNQGKTFGNAGKGGAGGTVSSASGAANVPKYNTSAPESGYYSGGKGLLGTAGTNKLTACQTYVAGNAYDQQECDAVNFLAKNPSERPIVPLSKTDPIITGWELRMPAHSTDAANEGADEFDYTVKRGDTLSQIALDHEGDAGKWPEAANAPGTRGGTNFRNNEGLLPRTGSDGRRLRFQEWDVNPKKPGRGRDAERIITADDGSAWYTDDHYSSFRRILE